MIVDQRAPHAVAGRAAELLSGDDPVGAIHLAEVALSVEPHHAGARAAMLTAHPPQCERAGPRWRLESLEI